MTTYRDLKKAIEENSGVPCEGNPDAFFLEEEYQDANMAYKIQTAKKLCAECPIQMLCLDYALENLETYGIWGGLTKSEREKILGRKLRYAIIHSGNSW